MFVNLNLPSIDKLLHKFVFSFKDTKIENRIMNSDISLVNGIEKSVTGYIKIAAFDRNIMTNNTNISLVAIYNTYDRSQGITFTKT